MEDHGSNSQDRKKPETTQKTNKQNISKPTSRETWIKRDISRGHTIISLNPTIQRGEQAAHATSSQCHPRVKAPDRTCRPGDCEE